MSNNHDASNDAEANTVVPMTFTDSVDSPNPQTQLHDLLDATDDPKERERITNNFYQLANGLPDAMLVQFALFSKALLQETALRQQSVLDAAPKIEADALSIAKAIAERTVFPDVDKIKQVIDANAQTVHQVNAAATTIQQQLAEFRKRGNVVLIALVALYFAGGAWFVWNDHHNLQKTIYDHVAARTNDAIDRIQYLKEHLDALKPFLDTGVRVSIARDSVSGDTVLFFEGTKGASLYYPRHADGKYSINVLQ